LATRIISGKGKKEEVASGCGAVGGGNNTGEAVEKEEKEVVVEEKEACTGD